MSKSTRIAIMGCGPGGAYLYALLRHRKSELIVEIFDLAYHTACGIKGCAWGASWRQFARLAKEVEIDPDKYVLIRYDRVLINGIKCKADGAIIDKPLLIKDLLGGISPLDPSDTDLSLFDRIVDASGVNRAYLLLQQKPNLVNAIQIRTANTTVSCPTVFLHRTGGYSWLFPLGRDEAHIGSLSPDGITAATEELDRVRKTLVTGQVLCGCSAKIYCSGPVFPFTEGKVWGLGETIGLVDPVACAGIIPAMNSAKLMYDNWDDSHSYEKQLWQYYSYMAKEAKTADKVKRGEKLHFSDLLLPRRAYDTLGIYPGFNQIYKVASIVKRL